MIRKPTTPTRSEQRIPTEAEELVEAIQLLHSLAYDVRTIARNLHVPVTDVQHVIQHDRLPQRQLPLAWADVAELPV